jgi:uncharacterized protein YdeI (YjbR/CyaY-like superfamily)
MPELAFPDPAALEAWLEAEHDTADELLLRIAKKGSGVASVTYAEALEVALCFGWIDGVKRGVDDVWFIQRFTPRRKRSRWSKINCDHVERLIAAGRMRPAGHAQVEAARADGRWDAAYAGSATMTVPPDLQAALDAEPTAATCFAGLDSRNRYAILYRIQDAKRADTRARRIATFVAMLAAGEKLHP